jgi:uncharacterized protein (TIGR00156 family)
MNRAINILLYTFLLFTYSAQAEFTGGTSKGGTATVEQFVSQCDLDSSGDGGLLSGLVSTGVEVVKCDEMEFIIDGNIIGQVSTDVYEFKDATGTINVEIRDWGGVDAGPDDRVRLTGKADYQNTGMVLSVSEIMLVN